MASPSRSSQACNACKRRKVRCNGQRQCQQCAHFNLKCVYTPVVRGRPRRGAASRGTVIEECRKNVTLPSISNGSPAIPSNGVSSHRFIVPSNAAPTISLPPIMTHPDPSFFLDLIPDYLSAVYPVNPIITEPEIRRCISNINSSREDASFVYAFAAITINLSRTDIMQSSPDIMGQISFLLDKSLDHIDPMSIRSGPSLLKVMRNIFIEICLMGLLSPDIGFLYLREAIAMLQMMGVENRETMSKLNPKYRCQLQRAFWECFIHERYTALSEYKPICLRPLQKLEHDPTIDIKIEHGWNNIIQTFLLVDEQFVDYWMGDRSQVTAEWIENKHRELENEQWKMEIQSLSSMQQADLIITRQWLHTLTWQMALSNILLSSDAPSESLSLTLPLRLSTQLRQLLGTFSHEAIGIHGTGVLNKLFEITTTIADVVIYLPQASKEDVIHRVDDIVFLKRFIFSFPRIRSVHKESLLQKFKKIMSKYPEIKELEELVISP
jgi:Fungal Zn(2)-Cys(6) binuclear cluster domain